MRGRYTEGAAEASGALSGAWSPSRAWSREPSVESSPFSTWLRMSLWCRSEHLRSPRPKSGPRERRPRGAARRSKWVSERSRCQTWQQAFRAQNHEPSRPHHGRVSPIWVIPRTTSFVRCFVRSGRTTRGSGLAGLDYTLMKMCRRCITQRIPSHTRTKVTANSNDAFFGASHDA